ncbi:MULTISPECIES: pentapeptide repeat-containing protein [Limnospira]|uniref:Pentapeptide repeat protein n=1 Tax=Limnospira indica PCC 8005 TaxID=376219 RepID=A0A9P1NYE1_9CYAN|nr:pentapeptide repeat-containing protein [Limnospira indica]RAQ49034.1 hypothetical protein B9S53_01095 [Arthrospira sp. O9.13F]CDM92405.1 conserved hypothetical protein [Limnospira indica PCC 8005]
MASLEKPSGNYDPGEKSSALHYTQSDTEIVQEKIYQYFIERVKQEKPDEVLAKFEALFLKFAGPIDREIKQSFQYLIAKNQQQKFQELIKRTCYILINNWYVGRYSECVQKLITKLNEVREQEFGGDEEHICLHNWLIQFLDSSDYQDIKAVTQVTVSQNWSDRYKTYLLVSQYANPENSWEHREVARNLSQKLRDTYKFELAMYLSRSESSNYPQNDLKNPTHLGSEVITLIKKAISTQSVSKSKIKADQLLQEVEALKYREFKHKFYDYLILNFDSKHPFNVISSRLDKMLNDLGNQWSDRHINGNMIQIVCNQTLEFLTIGSNGNPSPNFTLSMKHATHLTLAIILMKVVLISANSREHLDLCISRIINYYQNSDEQQCKIVINFLEVFNLVSTLFTENIQYNLVSIKSDDGTLPAPTVLETSRLFSQFQGQDLRQKNLKGVNLKTIDFKGADMREKNLKGMSLIKLDLRLVNLAKANLSHAILNGSKLAVANLKGANMQEASLVKTDLRRADLEDVNLSYASLTTAQLQRANLRSACLIKANLMAASLEGCDLQGADLSNGNLESAKLNQANLAHANLRGVNLRNANLRGGNLEGAHLEGADLRGADLQGANFKGANLHRANFYQANITEGNFNGANLRRVNFNRSDLRDAELIRVDLSKSRLRSACLQGANLSQSNLKGTDFTRADLSNAKFNGADLSFTLIRHANLSGADLTNAKLEKANLFGSNTVGCIRNDV